MAFRYPEIYYYPETMQEHTQLQNVSRGGKMAGYRVSPLDSPRVSPLPLCPVVTDC